MPSQHLRACITPSFDFLPLHVGNRLLCEEGTLAEALGRSLLDEHQ